ncbi:hypothetical protein TUM20985_50640 [Mycobacterium antarcticum]|uniref:LmeA family phospholipid-binding protein n=1 Tax=unclassified Mycolicibacterium TaxID=2636767 RepID=UPI00239F68D4|nr:MULTISPECIES: DUF2993 domain-containing protein [unclassified Mycolicibacterium]BDX34517.1 hypothetical protein TUM20985_50640 [Mycolicibacterium sp. TUM20985]GLP77721.1 hypothetical protein TUM20983_48310 [Mycolicibacterium sp. TUM20983]GLP81879.1 hypothetical protein TUM20984_32990 [Mycolicibacterium sp. TUM20984]
MTDPSDPWARQGQQPPQPYQPQPGYPAGPQYAGPPPQGYPPQGPPPTGASGEPTAPTEPTEGRLKRLVRDPLSIVLIFVIVLALGAAGLIGGEIYARNRAASVVEGTLKCVLQDDVTVSFGALPPFLWQHATKHYENITITSAGNQIRDLKGMKADIQLDDVRPASDPSSQGTLGSINVTATWSTDGMKQTVQNAIPLLGGLVSGVTTNAADGTVDIQGPLGSIVAKPQIVDNELSLQVQQLTGLGFTLPREAVQPALDAVSSQLTKNSPLALQVDGVEVTDTGVITTLSAQNATIPGGDEQPCVTGL